MSYYEGGDGYGGGHRKYAHSDGQQQQPQQQVHRVDFQRRAIEIAEGDSKLRQIFVGGVSMYASEDDLMRVFEPCGTVVALRWGTDRRTHKFKGFVHIEFASADAVPRAVDASGTDVKGRNIRVSAARGPSNSQKHQHNVQAITESPSKVKTEESTSTSTTSTASNSTSGEVCLRCRQPGHRMANCPKVGGSGTEGGRKPTVMCYNCGGNSHRASRCRKPKLGNGFTYATCFICGEKGHLSSQCEHNDKGLYPKGGGCRFCGSNKHLKKDCPDRAGIKKLREQAQSEDGGESTVPTWTGSREGHDSQGSEFENQGNQEQQALDGENFAVESMRGAEVELDATVGKKRKKKKKKKDKRKHKKAKKTTFD